MSASAERVRELRKEVRELRDRLARAEQILKAIQPGEFDDTVVETGQSTRVFTLQTADPPYRLLIEAMNEGAACVSEEGLLLFCNERFGGTMGRSAQELMGSPANALIPAAQRGRFDELRKQSFEHECEVEAEFEDIGERSVPVKLSLRPIPGAAVRSLWLVATDLSEVRREESAIREKADVIGLGHNAIVATDMSHCIRFWNQGAADLYGWKAEEAIGQITHHLLRTEFPQPLADIEASVRNHGEWHGELKHLSRGGNELVLESRWSLQLDEQGRPLGFLEVSRDISGRTQRQATLQAERKWLESLLDALPAMICLLKPDHHVAFANQAFRKVFGESNGRPCYEYCYGGSAPCTFCESFEVFKTHAPHDWEVVHHGRVIHAFDFPFADLDGSPLVLEMDVDVTEQREAQQALSRSEAQLKQAQHIARLGGWEWDVASESVKWTEELYQMMGLDRAQPAPNYDQQSRMYTPESWKKLSTAFETALREGIPYELEVETIRANGTHGWMLARGEPVRDANGAITRIEGVALDITECKQAEIERQRVEARVSAMLESTDDLIWSVDLDLRLRTFNQGLKNAIERNHGTSVEIGKLPEELLSADLAADWIRMYQRAIREGPFRTEYVLSYGGVLDVSLNCIVDNGAVVGISVFTKNITERKKAEAQLRESEERYRSVVTAISEGVVLQNADGKIIASNAAGKKILSMFTEQAVSQTSSSLQNMTIREDGSPISGVNHPAMVTLRTGQPQSNVCMGIRKPDGSVTWILVNSEPLLHDGEAEPYAVVSTFTDITRRKQAEHATFEERQKLNNILDALPPYVCLLTPDYHVAFANREFRRRFGESHGKHCYEILFGRDAPCEICVTYKVLETGNPQDWEWSGPDGRYYDIHDFPFIDTDGSRLILEMGIDVTERKKTELALQESEARFRVLANSVPQMIWMCSADGMNLYVNERWVDYTGITHEESHGGGWIIPFHPDDKQAAWDAWNQATASGETYQIESRLRAVDGTYRWFLMRGIPMRDGAGKVTCWFGTCTDIQEMKEAEEQLRRLNAELEDRVKQRTAELQQSERQVRRKLDSILLPDGDLGNLELEEILDIPTVQKLLEEFYTVVHVTVGVADMRNRFLATTPWKDSCANFHRAHPESCRNCVESDILLSAGVMPGEFKLYRCKNNLWDMATPIMIGDQQVGNLFFGQFLLADEVVDYDIFREQAKRYGFNEREYLKAIDEVPRLSRGLVNATMAFLATLSKVISQLSYTTIKLARSSSQISRINQELGAVNESLGAAQRAANAGIWNWNIQTGKITWSSELFALFGLPNSELASFETWRRLIHPEDRASASAAVDRAVKDRKPLHNQYRIVLPEGQERWIRTVGNTTYDEDQRPLIMSGICLDVTERKQVEETIFHLNQDLERRAAELEAIFRTVPIGLAISDDPRGRHIRGNPAMEIMLGATSGGELSKSVTECTPYRIAIGGREVSADDLPMQRAARGETVQGEILDILRSDGSAITLHANTAPLFDEAQQPRGSVGAFLDVTAVKRAEAALRESEADLARAQEAAHLGNWRWELGTDRVTWSEELYRIFGVDPQTFVPTDAAARALIHPDDRQLHAEYIDRAWAGGAVPPFECRIIHPDGEVRWVLASGIETKPEGIAKPQTLFGTILDITTRKASEDALRASETKYRTLFENIEEMVTVYSVERDESGRIVEHKLREANPAFLRAAGVSSLEEIRGRTSGEILGKTWSDSHLPAVQKTMETGQVEVQEVYRPEVGRYYLTSVVRLDSNSYLGNAWDITKIKQAEQRLRDRESELQGLTQNLQSGVALFDEHGEARIVNQAFRRIFEIPEDAEILNINSRDWDQWQVFGEDGSPLDMDDHPVRKAVLKLQAVRDQLVRMKCPSTSDPKWLLVSAQPILDAQGKLDRLISTYHDITARKHAEDALRQNEIKVMAAFENMAEAICIADASGTFVDFNNEYLRYHRFKQRDECCQTIADCSKYFDVWFKDSTPVPLEQWALSRALRGETATDVEYRLCSKTTGENWWGRYNFAPIRDQNGNIAGAVVTAREVTVLKQIEAALCKSENRFRDLANCLPDLLWTCTPDGKCDYINTRWVEYTGVEEADLLGFAWMLHVHPDDRELLTERWQASVALTQPFEDEFRIRSNNGVYRWFKTQAIAVKNEGGRVLKWYAATADIEDLKRTQEKLTAANKELESFNFAIAHDLRGPLRHIHGFAEMLAQEAAPVLNDLAQGHLHAICENAERMGLLLQELLNMARLGRHELQRRTCDLNALVRHVVAGLKQDTADRKIEWRIAELPTAYCDEMLIRQVLVNLLSNAVKFTRRRQAAVIEVGHIRRNGIPVFFVRDNGEGFDMQYADKLFGLFHRLHRREEFEGTGVGLAIVQRIVQKHGGSVWADAEEMHGATFYFSLQSIG